jgi:hypothetical protein
MAVISPGLEPHPGDGASMPIYRLDPILPLHVRWARLSSISEAVWTSADTATKARENVAAKTAISFKPAAGHAPLERSPWLDDLLCTCVVETDSIEVPKGSVVTITGRPV